MSSPIFARGLRRLGDVVRPGMLCAFGFDGTLAPIVDEPERAFIPAAISRRLMTLSEFARVAIITGRSVEDIGLRLDFLPDYLIGNHGIEGFPGWEAHAESYRHICQAWEQRLIAELRDQDIVDRAVWIENKTYSLSVHYRTARDRAGTQMQLSRLFANLLPEAHVIGGRCVLNLLPSATINKGAALDYVCEASGAPGTLYIGDDITDEAVFRLHREDLLTIRVEESTDSAAQFHMNHPCEMAQLLDELICRLSHPRPAQRRMSVAAGY
jgi:trehalose 6-phosphate phosphatase